MIFTQKHYIALAKFYKEQREIVKMLKSPQALGVLDAGIRDLCEMLEADNPKFKKHLFINACGFDLPLNKTAEEKMAELAQ